jgi:ABC-type phosphate transport system substrate-binding protein
MKLAKYLFLVALLVVPFTLQLQGQVLQANIGGSSAIWLEAGQGANAGLGCAWTDSNSTTNTWAADSRPAGGAKDFGKVWVTWNAAGGTCAAPGIASTVYAYISLDSGAGNRCVFANPQCTLNTIDVAGNAGSNALAGVTDTALPAGVLAAFNGQPITVAGSDITPMDALFATYQALAPCGLLSSGTQFQGYGRGSWPGPGTQIQATDGTAIFNVLGWQITGTDPFSGNPAAGAYTITPVGATPVVVFVNTNNAGGFGNAAIQNVTRFTLGLVESNILVRTSDFIPQVYNNAGGAAVTVWHRESLSGTYNTFDRVIANSKELYRPQEQQCPPVEPLNFSRTVGGFTSTNGRAIGTGDMVSQTLATPDSIGYAFWSAGNFKNALFGNVVKGARYLTVDGVDPLCTTYGCGGNPGQIPTATNGFLANVNLNNIQNGSYPIWSELRMVSINAAGNAVAAQIAAWAQAFVTTPGGAQPDYITAPNLNVIHAHFAPSSYGIVNDIPGVTSEGPRVCGAGGPQENGADAGGSVHTLQAGSDYAVLKGNYNAAGCTGITSLASFGVHN